MLLETVRIFADGLGHATWGVNAQLPLLDYDAGDSQPENIATIADETRSFLVALERPAEPYPSLSVAINSPADLEPEVLTSTRDFEIPVRIRLGLANDQAQYGMRDTYYYLRAIQKSLRDFGANGTAPEAFRTRNNVLMMEYTSMTHQPLFRMIEDAKGIVTGQLLVTVKVRDLNP